MGKRKTNKSSDKTGEKKKRGRPPKRYKTGDKKGKKKTNKDIFGGIKYPPENKNIESNEIAKTQIYEHRKRNNKNKKVDIKNSNESETAFIKASDSKNKIILNKNKIIIDDEENQENEAGNNVIKEEEIIEDEVDIIEEDEEENNRRSKKSNKNAKKREKNNQNNIKIDEKNDNSALKDNNSNQNNNNSNEKNLNSSKHCKKYNNNNKPNNNTNNNLDKNNNNSNQNINNSNINNNNSHQNINNSSKNNNNSNQNNKENNNDNVKAEKSEKDSVNGDIEMKNNVNNGKDKNVNDNNNYQNDENNNINNISSGGDESENNDREILSIQELDDILNPDEKLISRIQLIQYVPVKDDEIEPWINKYYLNGNIQDTEDKLSREQIKFVKWKDYTYEDYTNEDKELFAMIDRTNYIKRSNTNGYILNPDFEYEYKVIKNYIEFFRELYPETYTSDKYLKMDFKLTKVKNTKCFDPDIHIKIKKRKPELDDIVLDNEEDYDREDIKDKKKFNKNYNNSKSNNKKSNKKSDKSNQTLKKSKQKIQNNKQNKSKAKSKSKKKPIKKDSNSDEEDALSDENNDDSEHNNEDDDNTVLDENEFHTLKEIFKSKSFNQSHRINYYNAYRLYCSRILDIIFLKTCWKDFFYRGKTFREELPMICLPCMQIYSVNGFSKHLKHCHDRNLKPLSSLMKRHTKTFVDENKNQYKKKKNHNYGNIIKYWLEDEIKSKGGDGASNMSDFKNDDDVKSIMSYNNNNLFKSSININNIINNPFKNDKINNLSKSTFNNLGQNYNNSKQNILKSGHFQRKNRFIKANINNNNVNSDSQSIGSGGMENNYIHRKFKISDFDVPLGTLKYKQTDVEDNIYLFVLQELFTKAFVFNDVKGLLERVENSEKAIIKSNKLNNKYDEFMNIIEKQTLDEIIELLKFHLGYSQKPLAKIIYARTLLKIREWKRDLCSHKEIDNNLNEEKEYDEELKKIINENDVILKQSEKDNKDDNEKKISPERNDNNNDNISS